MARAFWPGYTWRILAHKRNAMGRGAHSHIGAWHCVLCGWKGESYTNHPKTCPAGRQATKGNAPAFGTPDWEAWRYVQNALRHSATVSMHSSDVAEPVQFDELVIDNWFHLEQMSERHYWMRVGNYDLNVHIDGKGVASVGVVEDS